MSNETWKPVADGEYDEIEVKGDWLAIDGRDSDGLKTYLGTILPDNLRLCERVPDNRPRPDWSQAPEWARWWAVNPRGHGYWYASEPNYRHGTWDTDRQRADGVDALWDGVTKEIPLGQDWRTLVERRPEPQS